MANYQSVPVKVPRRYRRSVFEFETEALNSIC